MAQTQSNRAGETQERPRRRWAPVLMKALGGVVLAALVCLGLTVLIGSESLQGKLSRLGFGQTLGTPPLLVIAGVITVLYTLHPLLGSIAALIAVFPVLALYHFGLAVLYVVCAVLALPCLGKRGGVFLFVLAALAAEYPVLAMFLPCLPVVAGLLYGRGMGWYAAAALVLVVLVAGLVAGRERVGMLRIGDGQPLMESEGPETMKMIGESFFPLLSPEPELAEYARLWDEYVGPYDGTKKWWESFLTVLTVDFFAGLPGLWVLVVLAVLIEMLWPRLLPLLPQVLLWAIVGEATAWAVWALRRRAADNRRSRSLEQPTMT